MTTKKGFEIRNRLRKVFPYALMKTDDGKVVFFNREYEVMCIAGQQEFEADVDSMDVEWESVRDAMFLMDENGEVYVGTVYYLYDDANNPFWLEQQEMATYLQRLGRVMEVMVTPIGNAFANGTFSKEQMDNASRRLAKLYFRRD